MGKEVLGEHFWGHVLGTAAVGVGDGVLLNVRLGESKISDFDFAVAIEEDVF